MRILAIGLGLILALGCASTPDTPGTTGERTDPDAIQAMGAAALERALAAAQKALADEDWIEAWDALEKAATLDTARAHEGEIAEGRLACGKALAVDGARVDFWGLFPDRRRGIEMLTATARNHRYHEVAPKALYYAAQTYRYLDEPDFAQLYLDQLVRLHADSEWAETAEYERAQALLQAARTLEHDLAPLEEAHWRLQMYLELYPTNPNTEKAKQTLDQVENDLAQRDFRTGRWYEWMGLPDAARIYYNEVLRRFPGSAWAVTAGERLTGLPPQSEEWPPTGGPTPPSGP